MSAPKIVPEVLSGSDPRVALYVYGVFDSKNGTDSPWQDFPTWINYIQDSDFNVVVFSTFHVDSSGNLSGNVPLVTNGVFNPNNELYSGMPSLYKGLQQSGKTLLYSIGNWAGTSSDLSSLESILAQPSGTAYANLKNNMTVLTETLGITGIDFDFEADYTASAQNTVTKFTSFCNDLGLFVTYCPYQSGNFWIDAQKDAVDAGGKVKWWNVQCYGPGYPSPSSWLSSIQPNAQAMGISGDPVTFLVPGTVVTTTGTTLKEPATVEAQFSQWAETTPGLNGGFLWQFGNLVPASANPCPPWANAVINGLANGTPSANDDSTE